MATSDELEALLKKIPDLDPDVRQLCKLEGLGEPAGRLTKDDGTPVEYYRRSDLKPGDRIAFQVSGFNVKQSDRYTWAVLIAVFGAAVVIALLRLHRKPAGSKRRT